MTDVEFILREDSRSKKSAGRGVYARKRGSKSKACSLPSDRLTEKQKKELSGEVKTYNLSTRLSYAEFKQLPPDLMAEYINKLVSTYGANINDIAHSMGVTRETLRVFRNDHPVFPKFKPGGRSAWAKPTSTEWAEFLEDKRYSNGAMRFVDAEDVQPVHDEPEDIQEEKEPAPVGKILADEISVNLTGTPQQIADFISQIVDKDSRYRVHIELYRAEE